MNAVNRLQSVQPLGGTLMEIRYTGGQVVRVDFAGVTERLAIFAELKNPDFFQRATVTDWGHTLQWPNGEGLDADRLMEMALEQAGRSDALAFRHWQDRHGLSLAQAATAIGLSRRTVSQYRTGARPVPRTVALACKGWEAERAA
ncbi:MAG: helix-turn-helix domain-containing protein [Burkholderiaceae bacterium]|jgi:DNA-binding XRE family transcriptional regulator|nr:helix-turn-helix domain-containing protein [Burkholderiaceae bacterium]